MLLHELPEDPRLHFLSQGEWFRYISPEHGVGSNIAPAYLPDEDLEIWPEVEGKRPFHWDRLDRHFDEPFYLWSAGQYGANPDFRPTRMATFLLLAEWGWQQSAAGRHVSGLGLRMGHSGAVYEVGREYTFDLRLVYKEFVSDEDVMAEYHKALCTECGLRHR